MKILCIILVTLTILFNLQIANAETSLNNVLIDKTRNEVNMKLLAFDKEPFKGAYPTGNRKVAYEVFSPSKTNDQLPIIIFSGGFGEDYRFYSTILENLKNKGYIIINIDHYYYQNTLSHLRNFDSKVAKIRNKLDKESQEKKEKLFMRAKEKALDIYYKDIILVLDHLREILPDKTDFKNIILMGHSLGGNAGKKVIEDNKYKNIRALIALDSRLNQLGLKTQFELPTLVIGAQKHYVKPDPLRQLPKQPNLKIDILDHTTHVSFDDIAIYTLLEKDLSSLKKGLNESAKLELENNIEEIAKGNKTRFGDELFLGNKKQMEEFLINLNEKIDSFIKHNIDK